MPHKAWAFRTFLQVRIVREKTTGKIMAMKKLKKAEMLKRGQVGYTAPDSARV